MVNPMSENRPCATIGEGRPKVNGIEPAFDPVELETRDWEITRMNHLRVNRPIQHRLAHRDRSGDRFDPTDGAIERSIRRQIQLTHEVLNFS